MLYESQLRYKYKQALGCVLRVQSEEVFRVTEAPPFLAKT